VRTACIAIAVAVILAAGAAGPWPAVAGDPAGPVAGRPPRAGAAAATGPNRCDYEPPYLSYAPQPYTAYAPRPLIPYAPAPSVRYARPPPGHVPTYRPARVR